MQVGQYLQWLTNHWWPFCRIMAVLALAPLFNYRALPLRVRVLLALGLTLALGRALPQPPAVDPLSLQGVVMTLEQIAFGLLLGLALQLVFAAFTLVGAVVSTQMGLSMAMLNDPVNGVSSSPILYQIYFVLLAFLFFASDVHLVTVSVLYQSFVHWPLGSGLHYAGMGMLLQSFAWVFAAATLIAVPMMFCMMLVQFCFGLLNRISPAMNLFSLGFPSTIVSGLLLIPFTLPNVSENYLNLTRQLLDGIAVMLRNGHG
jgi:flagellar biosynthetic protein FliR